jgi:hypothetical protein
MEIYSRREMRNGYNDNTTQSEQNNGNNVVLSSTVNTAETSSDNPELNNFIANVVTNNRNRTNNIMTEINNRVINIIISPNSSSYEVTSNVTPSEIENYIIELFSNIDSHGHYTDHNWLMNLSVERIKVFIKEMCDIFTYRAGLTDDVKRRIIPDRGEIGEGNIRHFLNNTDSINQLRFKAYIIMYKLVNRGISMQDRALGTFYVLTALTVASYQAAQAMPWLYQSTL